MSSNLRIPSATDAQLLRCICEASELVTGVNKQTVVLMLFGGVREEFSLPGEVEELKAHPVFQEHAKSISSLTWSAQPISFNYWRGGRQDATKTAFQDEIALNMSAGGNSSTSKSLDDEVNVAVLQLITRRLSALNVPGDTSVSPLGWDELFQNFEGRVAQIESVHHKMLDQVTEVRGELEREFRERRSDLEEEYAEKEQKLEDNWNKKLKRLDEREQRVDEREESLEAQDSRIFRRRVRSSLIEELKQRSKTFSLTDGTNKKRAPVNRFLLTLFVLSSIAAVFWTLELSRVNLSNASTLDAFTHIAKSSISTFLAVAIGFYAITWSRKWHEKHADAEFHLKQFELDVERSSLVIEAALEWRGEDGKGEMPEKLLEALTRNLFEYDEKDKGEAENASDMLASAILGSSASTKLKVGNADLELNRKGIDALRKKSV